MIQHMNLVFQADGLKTGEGAFLMACANHTDDKGYVIAHMQQLADEAHMTLRSAQNQRAALEKRGLLKSKERYSPKNNAQIANLFRINLELLVRLQRKPKDYGPSLIEELTFNAPPTPAEENRRSDPHENSAPPPADSAPPPAESAPPPAKSAGGGGAKSAPLLLPSSVPSSLSGDGSPSGDGPEAGGERETAAQQQDQEHRERSGEQGAADAVVAAYETAAGLPMVNGMRAKFRRQAVEVLATGRPVEWVAARAAEMPAKGWVDLIVHCTRSKKPIPSQAGPSDGMCPKHPQYRAGRRCVPCAVA